MNQKKWDHLNLFQKFAVIFFVVVALSVTLIALNIIDQNTRAIVAETDQVVHEITNSMKMLAQIQQTRSEAAIDAAIRELTHISKESLWDLQKNLIEVNKDLYNEEIEKSAFVSLTKEGACDFMFFRHPPANMRLTPSNIFRKCYFS